MADSNTRQNDIDKEIEKRLEDRKKRLEKMKGNIKENTALENDEQQIGILVEVDCCGNGCIVSDAANACSVREGNGTTASGAASHAEGNATNATGNQSHAEGNRTTASGGASHAEGVETEASGDNSHAEGRETIASGDNSHAEGFDTEASEENSHAEGFDTEASGFASHAEGSLTKATGNAGSHAEGAQTTASGGASHAQGNGTVADSFHAHAEGSFSVASGMVSHAEGEGTFAGGTASHTEGIGSQANGDYSHAEGSYTISNGAYSHAEGLNTNTNHLNGVHIMGKFGAANDLDYSWYLANGTSVDTLGIAAKIMRNGIGVADIGWLAGGTDYSQLFETIGGKPIDPGYFVTLKGKKIRKANHLNDYILGVTSGNPALLANNGDLRWKNKYITDEWGRIQYHKVVIPAEKDDKGEIIVPEYRESHLLLNPHWDPTQEYLPRLKRPEWTAVALMGSLLVRDDGTCQVDGYCLPNDDGMATASLNGYRVMERTSENQILILFK